MDKTVTFKNGKTTKITQEVADVLYDRMIGGCNTFQCFWNATENKSHLIINVSEIVCIE